MLTRPPVGGSAKLLAIDEGLMIRPPSFVKIKLPSQQIEEGRAPLSDSVEYQRIAPMMGQLWSPIAAVTSRWRDKVNAQIAVAIGAASIVPNKPRVVVQIYKGNYSHQLIQQSGAFALNFLRQDQLGLIKDFGLVSGKDRDKLSSIDYKFGVSGSPILQDCWGYLDCRVVNAMDAGDMTCFLAEVLDGDTVSDSEPLWWREARRRLPPEWMEEWERKISAEIEISMQQMQQIDYTPWKPG
jgi:flavin reductase (DIM6/NTAB) family NADH-FMN oxidoreductase RutF